MDDFDIDEFNDICGLGDIFPEIEPYLKDVTDSFENAKAESGKQRLDVTIDSSDSDSGISGDSFATGILNNLEMSISNDLSEKHENTISIDKLDNFKLFDTRMIENSVSSEFKANIPKLTLKVPTTIRANNDRTILNIIQKSTDMKPKHIIIKSHQSLTKLNDNFKREPDCIIPNVTKVKILKPNQNYPIIVNKSNSMNVQSFTINNDSNHFNDYPKINLKEIKKTDNIISKNFCNEYSSNDLSIKTSNSFLSENHNRIIGTEIKNGLYGRKSLSLDISNIDDFKTMDNSDSYYDMFQSSPTTDENTLSPAYNSFNSNGSINPQQFDRIIKKQERMIKNRQAASLSRQRKKEYVERLEHKVELQKHENQHLQNQVNEVKERCCSLEQENLIMKRDLQMWRDRYYDLERQKMKQGIPVNKHSTLKVNDAPNKGRVVKTTAATTILGIFVLLTFNFNSWTEINQKVSLIPTTQRDSNIPMFSNNNNLEDSLLTKKIIGTENRIGRTLFSIIENASLPEDILKNDMYNQLCNNSTGLNLTETTRLTLELNKWGSRYKAESVKEYDRIQNEKIKSQILNKEINSIYKKTKHKYNQIPNNKLKGKHILNSAEVELYQKSSGFDFLDSIFDDFDRKSDTLYFVSFHSDNLIYPATTNTKNFSTPKITLLLPADVRQEDELYYKMMKIDCHVQNFTLVNLKKMKQP